IFILKKGSIAMTLKQLEYFLAIAEAGHITAAAKNLNISQPPLSLQLKALEDELGVQLFERDKRNLTITHEGLILKERAVEILALVNDTVRELQNLGTDAQGTIHIGTISSACSHLLPDRIVRFRQDHPNVDFQVFEGNSVRVIEMLESGEVDLGIVREPFNTSIYNSVLLKDDILGDDEADFFVAVGLPSFFDDDADTVSLTDLKGKPLILHRRYNDMLTNYCRQKGFSPNTICQNNELASSLSWAEAGIGVALVANNATVQAVSGKVVIKKIVNPTITAQAYLVWNKSHNISNLAKQFVELFE
ncbi:MAG: LysR family transcriptional regulator, partial [Lachnospiraceae bacterium]|nr:LysR family transcriptional regulator [Lachnospiraceae bacterium]